MLETMTNTNEASHDDSGWAQLCSLTDAAMKTGKFGGRNEAFRHVAQEHIELAMRAKMPASQQSVAEHLHLDIAQQQTFGAGVDDLARAVEKLAEKRHRGL